MQAFCAGGDVKWAVLAAKAGDLRSPEQFFRYEYRLNLAIAQVRAGCTRLGTCERRGTRREGLPRACSPAVADPRPPVPYGPYGRAPGAPATAHRLGRCG